MIMIREIGNTQKNEEVFKFQNLDDVPATDEALRNHVARADVGRDFSGLGLHMRHRLLRDRRKTLIRSPTTGSGYSSITTKQD